MPMKTGIKGKPESKRKGEEKIVKEMRKGEKKK